MNIFLARPVRWRSTSTPSGELAVMCWGLSTSVKPTARGEPTTWGEAWSAAWCEGVGSKFPETAVGLGSAGARLNRAAPSWGGGGSGELRAIFRRSLGGAAQHNIVSSACSLRCRTKFRFVICPCLAAGWCHALELTALQQLHCAIL